jgi:uncharacterized protein with von Willebrand factor type A (vWA) domain
MIELNLSKEKSLIQLDLRKQEVSTIVSEIPELNGLKARVALVLDFSGSMSGLYRDGTVQAVIERIMPIAMQFDDNQELDLWIFENGFKRLGGVTKENFYGLAKELLDTYHMGGTNYAPVMDDIYNKYIKEEPAQLPNYIIFITDGDNFDKSETTKVISKLSKSPIFFQFVGIGDENFEYLKKLDDMSGRYVDNANFFKVENINELSDRELYQKLFAEYPSWLSNPLVQDLINSTTAKPKGLFGKLFGK